MNAADYLLNTPAADSDVALITPYRAYTYGELRDAATRIGSFLLASGAKAGDRAALIANSSFFWAAAYIGCMRAGCVIVPLSAKLEPNELTHILQSCEPRFVFADNVNCRRVSEYFAAGTIVISDSPAEINASPLQTVSLEEIPGDGVQQCARQVDARSTPAALMFTSGSTGKPRGVIVSHRNIIANTDSIVEYLGVCSDDRVMAVLPFHYCFGTSLLHTHLRVGASIVIDHRFMFPNVVLDRMQATKCTGFAGVPSHYQILLRASKIKQMQLPHLRWLQQAGGNLPAAFINELRRILPHVRMFVMYGQTEATARLSYVPPELLAKKAGSIGTAIPGVTLRVVNQDGSPVPPGELGEIEASGDNIALGYWGDPEQTAAVFREGKLRTGDIAIADEDAFLYLVDRARDFVKCGGTRVCSKHIEEALLECDELVEAAVIGVPDDVLGEAIKAFVVPKKDAPHLLERVLSFCHSRLHHSLVPKEVVVLKALPKNDAGKILKSALRADHLDQAMAAGHVVLPQAASATAMGLQDAEVRGCERARHLREHT